VDISILEQHALFALLRLHPNGYGVSVRDELLSKTGKKYSIGSVYATLDRLTRKGFAEPRQGESTRERGGKAKLYFTITGEGRRTLDQSMKAFEMLREGLPEIGACT
jgi:PadR family transcriptional regulator PadR